MPTQLTIPTSSSQAFEAAMHALTPKWMTKNLSYSLTHIYRMAAHENTTEAKRRDPFCMAELIIKGLVDMGQKRLAVAIVDRMAKAVGGELSFRNVTPDKDSFLEETLDTNEAVARFHIKGQELLKDNMGSIENVRAAKKRAHIQIDEEFKALTLELEK